jgi:hypothetical protein
MQRFFHLATEQNTGAKTYLNLNYSVLALAFKTSFAPAAAP